jgi:hypothetical protein
MKSIFMATKNIDVKKYGAHIQAVLKVFQEIEKFDINSKDVSINSHRVSSCVISSSIS